MMQMIVISFSQKLVNVLSEVQPKNLNKADMKNFLPNDFIFPSNYNRNILI